ncbi:hypothetical protein EMCRGX_G008324 [Ephydatia muelleri]
MAVSEDEVASWKLEETVEWALKQYNSRVAHRFEEQEIDGETLLMLCKTGTTDQLKACGLETVKDQLKLKKLIQGSEKTSVVAVTEQVACGTSCIELNRKLSLPELGKISPEDRRIYHMMRNKVRKAVYDTWKGNSIPLFKTDSAERQKLEELAATLIPTCKTKYFGERAIRQHIFDSLNEKKRRIRKGVDYTKPRIRKAIAKETTSSVGVTNASKFNKLLLALNAATAPAITSHDLTEVQCLKIATAQVSPSCDPSPESQCLNSVKSAEVIVLQAFGVHFLKEVTRQQLVRAINNHLPQNAERKALLTAPKTSLLKPLAQGLLAKKIIQINSGADVCDLTRDDILVLTVYLSKYRQHIASQSHILFVESLHIRQSMVNYTQPTADNEQHTSSEDEFERPLPVHTDESKDEEMDFGEESELEDLIESRAMKAITPFHPRSSHYSTCLPWQKREILARVRAFNTSGFRVKMYGNVCQYYQSFLGRDFKAWAQMAIFILKPYLNEGQAPVWLSFSKIAICVDASKAAEWQSVCQGFIDAVKQHMPSLLQKPKTHMILHLVQCMKELGPSSAFSAESCGDALQELFSCKYMSHIMRGIPIKELQGNKGIYQPGSPRKVSGNCNATIENLTVALNGTAATEEVVGYGAIVSEYIQLVTRYNMEFCLQYCVHRVALSFA